MSWPRIYVFRDAEGEPGGWYVSAECLGWHEAEDLVGLVRDPVAFEVESVPSELAGAVQAWQRDARRVAEGAARVTDADSLAEGETVENQVWVSNE